MGSLNLLVNNDVNNYTVKFKNFSAIQEIVISELK